MADYTPVFIYFGLVFVVTLSLLGLSGLFSPPLPQAC